MDSPNTHDAEIAPTGGAAGEAGRLDDQLCFALYAATNAITRTYRPMLKKLGLTYSQYLVMLVLWEHQSLTVGEIAASLHLATHAVSPIADRLEAAGLARRIRDDDDGRIVRLELTEEGRAMESAVPPIQNEVWQRTLMGMPDVVRLRTELRELAERLDKL